MEIKKYVDIVRRRFVLILLTLIVTMAVVAIGTSRMTPVYQASTTLRVAMSSTGSIQYSDYMYADRLMNTYVEIANGKPLQDQIAKQLGIRPEIKAEIISNTELIKITVKGSSPQMAAQAANAVAAILIEQNNKLFIGGGKSLTEVLTEQMTVVQSDLTKSQSQYATLLAKTPPAPESIIVAQQSAELAQSNYSSLLQQLEQAKAREGIQASMITVVEAAAVPVLPSAPQPLLNLGLAFLVGLVGGLGLALLFENLDTTLYSIDAIEAATKLPALAKIPTAKQGQIGRFVDGCSPFDEAFRGLAAYLQATVKKGKKALLVMSTEPNQGKSMIAFHLACSLAEVGKSVVVVDCDTRMPKLHTFFGLPNRIGLRDVLEGDAKLEDALQPSSFEGLQLLTSGSRQLAHPSHALGSVMMERLVEGLTGRFDYVLLDSPAMLEVADVAALTPHVGGLMLVVRQGHARKESLQAASSFLARQEGKSVFLIVNQVHNISRGSYYKAQTNAGSFLDSLKEKWSHRGSSVAGKQTS